AERSAREAARLLPDRPVILYNLSNILRELGKLDEAETLCRKALAIHERFAEQQTNMRSQDRMESADEALRSALRSRPNYVDALNGLGATLAEMGRVTEATEVYRRALTIDPNRAEAHSN